MEYSPSDVWEGVWAAAARVGGQENGEAVERIAGSLPDLAGEIGAAIEAEGRVQWHSAGVSFAAEILASASLIRVVEDKPAAILKDGRLPDWVLEILNDWGPRRRRKP